MKKKALPATQWLAYGGGSFPQAFNGGRAASGLAFSIWRGIPGWLTCSRLAVGIIPRVSFSDLPMVTEKQAKNSGSEAAGGLGGETQAGRALLFLPRRRAWEVTEPWWQ